MKRKNIIIILIILLLAVLSGAVLFIFAKGKDKNRDNEIIVKENVTVITDKTEPEKQPIEVRKDELVFSDDPHYVKDDIIVAGITESAPEGFIRRVLNVEKDGPRYIVKTEYAVLTDVFEELHLTKMFMITPGGISETAGWVHLNADKGINPADIAKMADGDDDGNTDYQFYQEFEEEIKDNITLKGSVGFNAWLEMKFDISHGDIIFGMALHNETDGELFVGCSGESGKDYRKEIVKKYLPAYQFMVAGVPIVVTNEIFMDISGSASLEGSLGISFGLGAENTSGFLYNSKKNKVEDIKKREYLSDGLEWDTELKVSGESSAKALLHLASKLYGCTGADIAVGISGEANGEISKSIIGPGYDGSLDLSIEPKLQGTLVVSIPVVDKKLVEQPLFRVSMEPFWEQHWPSDSDDDEDSENKEPMEDEVFTELNHEYQTKFGEANMVTYPQFAFDYPDGWTITQEEVTQTGETVVLTNERGATITFSYIGGVAQGELGGGSHASMARADVVKVADSKFIPSYVQGTDHSDLGKFMVSKIKVNGQLDMLEDSDFKYFDGPVSYAVLPESREGVDDDVRYPNIVQFSFWYSGYVSLVAESPNGRFWENEETEIIEILSSFRVEP